MKEYSLGLGARRIGYSPRRGRRESGRRTTGGSRMELRRSGAKPQKPKTYFENKILKLCSCIRHHSSIGIAFCTSIWPSFGNQYQRFLDHSTFPFSTGGQIPLLPLHAGAHEGVSLLVIFTIRRRSESKCEISVHKDRLLRLKRTVRVERIDTHQYNRCLNHLMDTHQNNRSD